MPELRAIDWPTILAEVRAGILSKGEICRKFGVNRNNLEQKIAANGIIPGDLLSRIHHTVRAESAAVSLLSDEEIVGKAADRSMAVIKSHLTLTRSLQARLALLVEGYDEVVQNMNVIDQDGNKSANPKDWLVAANLLNGLTQVAERLTKMEMATFGVSASDKSPAGTGDVVEEFRMSTDDPIEASLTYQRVMQGG